MSFERLSRRKVQCWQSTEGYFYFPIILEGPPPLPLLLLPVMVCLTEATIKTNPFVQISIEFLLPCLLRVTVNEEWPRLRRWMGLQCDQIGLLLIYFGSKFSHKNSPHIWQLFVCWEMVLLKYLNLPLCYFWRKIGYSYSNFGHTGLEDKFTLK